MRLGFTLIDRGGIYVCETEVTAEWFTGASAGNRIKLESTSGNSTITATLEEKAVEGEVTLPDGQTKPFNARPSTGIDGLYEVDLQRDSRIAGASDRGAQVAASISDARTNRTPLGIRVVAADGDRRTLQHETGSGDPAGAVEPVATARPVLRGYHFASGGVPIASVPMMSRAVRPGGSRHEAKGLGSGLAGAT